MVYGALKGMNNCGEIHGKKDPGGIFIGVSCGSIAEVFRGSHFHNFGCLRSFRAFDDFKLHLLPFG
jgi:hypothetical protein